MSGSNTDLCCMRRTVNFARKEGCVISRETVAPAHRARGGSSVPRNFFRGGVQQIQLRTERRGSGGSGPLVRGSGGSCNLVQQISFHIVTFS
jgi:hypothetical protein